MRLKERLQGTIPKEKLNHLSNRYHVIGDVAILSIPGDLSEYGNEIAQTILSQSKNIRTVLNKTSRLEGECRVAKFEHLAGNGTVTVHREFGFFYRLDVARVFFNSHLGYERMRVASQVHPGENVLMPFAGVGPFVVPIASRGVKVIALEKNREACRWLAENAKQNRVYESIEIINADAFHITKMLKMDFDRAVLPAPYGMDHFLKIVLQKVKRGGRLHFYTFKKRYQIPRLKKYYEDLGLQIICIRRCGNVAPGVSRWVFDMEKVRS